jgi:TRAP-type C4-dicarboxylate transport system substrate-binding protein
VLTALQTGLVEAVQGPPLYAMVEQWFGLANNMIDVKWSPLVAATVLRKESWEKIPLELRQPLLEAARVAGRRLLGEIRGLNDDAIPAMQKRGLNLIQVDEVTLAVWRSEADKSYPELRGRYAPADLFDEVQRLRDEFRQQVQPPSQ